LVSTEHAKKNLKTLIQIFGQKLGMRGSLEVYAFPTPQQLSHARVEKIGLTRTKAGAIRALARAVCRGGIDFRSHREFSDVMIPLLKIKGIGPWTATMIAMRCLGDPDAFPAQDLIIARAVKTMSIDLQAWMSSRAYLTHYLWRDFGHTLSKKRRRT
jgi:AraC family transcriptional regulator of adaptative response / DNA-3-methyladenine glycosylase II